MNDYRTAENEWFHNSLKTCSKAYEMEWLCNGTSLHFT